MLSRFRAQLAEGEASNRSFGLTLGAIFAAIGLVPLIRHRPMHLWAVALGVILILLGMVYPSILRGPKLAWLFLGFLLGLVINPIVLAVLFFTVLTPVGVLMRAFGRDPMWTRKPSAPTYWRTRTEPPSDMSQQF